jgi:hypothetical protein
MSEVQTPTVEIGRDQPFREWLEGVGSGEKDQFGNPQRIIIPKEAGWLSWFEQNKGKVKADKGRLWEPFADFTPPDKLTDIGTVLHDRTKLGIVRQLVSRLRFGTENQTSSISEPVMLHLHPSFDSDYPKPEILSPPDVASTIRTKELQMLVALTPGGRASAVLKNQVQTTVPKVPPTSRLLRRLDNYRGVESLKEANAISLYEIAKFLGDCVPNRFLSFYVGRIRPDEDLILEEVQAINKGERKISVSWLDEFGEQEISLREFF